VAGDDVSMSINLERRQSHELLIHHLLFSTGRLASDSAEPFEKKRGALEISRDS
jgi:hypothetical protein